MTTVSQIQTNLNSIHELGFNLIEPILIPEDDLAAIAQLRDNPGDPRAWINYHVRLPITVARLKQDAEREILDWCQKQTDTCTTGLFGASKDPFLIEKVERYEVETKQFASILFGANVETSGHRAQGGFFEYGEERVKCVHGDNIQQFTCTVLTRSGALCTEFISEKNRQDADPETKELIKRSKREDGSLERNILRARGILKPSNLGDVILFADGTGATLHASSPVPADGAHSFFAVSSHEIKGVRPSDFTLLKYHVCQKLRSYLG